MVPGIDNGHLMWLISYFWIFIHEGQWNTEAKSQPHETFSVFSISSQITAKQQTLTDVNSIVWDHLIPSGSATMVFRLPRYLSTQILVIGHWCHFVIILSIMGRTGTKWFPFSQLHHEHSLQGRRLGVMACKITGNTTVCSTAFSG